MQEEKDCSNIVPNFEDIKCDPRLDWPRYPTPKTRVMMLSRHFMKGHPRAGELTWFIPKIWAALVQMNGRPENIPDNTFNFYQSHIPKWHTIRPGNRFKAGDFIDFRYWSGMPYRSPQLKAFPFTIPVERVFNIEIDKSGVIMIDGVIDCTGNNLAEELAKNDGLSHEDFLAWFSKTLPFNGQIICWSKDIKYNPE
jgi:hypothetical protein